jgi:hypothetical protein
MRTVLKLLLSYRSEAQRSRMWVKFQCKGGITLAACFKGGEFGEV